MRELAASVAEQAKKDAATAVVAWTLNRFKRVPKEIGNRDEAIGRIAAALKAAGHDDRIAAHAATAAWRHAESLALALVSLAERDEAGS